MDLNPETRVIRTLLVCDSTHHGNTRQIADAMAAELQADVVPPEKVTPTELQRFDLVGFGSGIYFGLPGKSLRRLVAGLQAPLPPAFLFSTSGLPIFTRLWHSGLRRRLKCLGCEIWGEFSCPGWDTVGPLRWIGGIHRRRPDDRDRESARQFARTLAGNVP